MRQLSAESLVLHHYS